jgi:hypothetical protein
MTNNEKVLFLWLSDKEFHAVNARKRGVSVEQVYKHHPLFLRAIRRVHLELKLPYINSWIGPWKNNLTNYDLIIIHASTITPPVVKYIRKKEPNIRIIVWYWNPVDKSVRLDEFKGLGVEIWSFDEEDCKKYKLRNNTQYYFKDVVLPKKDDNLDVFFIGGDKGRIENLLKFKNRLDDMSISNYFHITQTGKANPNYKEFYSNRISYDEVLNYIASCKVIVDFVSDNQTGLTLRPLEALFFKKKLITNDKSIENRDFYNKNNTFIVGKDELSSLPNFVKSPYINLDTEIIEKYDFDKWLIRFFNN